MKRPILASHLSSSSKSSWSQKLEKIKSRFGHQPVADNEPGLQQPWKPVTMKFSFLALLFLVTVAIIAALEYLHYVSKGFNAGGVAFASSPDVVTSTTTFLYLYLPTLLAVLYAMVWSWVNLDFKRLEPWFRLSTPDGATAEDSILLHYPFDFGPFVPFKSAHRGHWAVFLSSSAAVLVAFVIVPLQAAIFTANIAHREGPAHMEMTHSLAPADQQSSLLGTHFLAVAYGVSWLDQRTPQYTTKEFALVPFSIKDSHYQATTNGTWTAPTRMYWSNLTCSQGAALNSGLVEVPDGNYSVSITSPGQRRRAIYDGNIFHDTEGSPSVWDFDDSRGCQLKLDIGSLTASMSSGYEDVLVDYIPFWPREGAQFLYNNNTCTIEGSNMNKFLLLTSASTMTAADRTQIYEGTPEYHLQIYFNNLMALYCQPAYYTRSVNATVDSSTGQVMGLSYLTEPEPLSSDHFNITHFEYTVGHGAPPIRQIGNANEILPVDHNPRLLSANIGLYGNASQVVGNALASDISLYSNASAEPRTVDLKRLEEALSKSHKLLFSAAINQLMVARNSTESELSNLPPDAANGRISSTAAAVVYVRLYAIIVEVCLGVTSILICALWLYARRRGCNLQSDPGCISQVMSLIRSSDDLIREFLDHGATSKRQLAERLQGRYFYLKASSTNSSPYTKLDSSSEERSQQTPYEVISPDDLEGVRPWELSYAAAAAGIVILGGALFGISHVFTMVAKTDGIPRPTDDPRVLAIIENAVPVAFASLLKPSWIIFNRLICALQPFKDLHKNYASAKQTIQAKYTTVPPPLAIWGAVRAKHLLLALVCAATISASALAVSLGGLIVESKKTYRHSTEVNKLYSGTLDQSLIVAGSDSISRNPINRLNGGKGNVLGNTFHDHLRRFIANSSGEAPLPNWVDDNYYYLPFAIPPPEILQNSSGGIAVTGYSAITQGFGVSLECSELTYNGSTRLVFEYLGDGRVEFAVVNEHSDTDRPDRVETSICAARGGMNPTSNSGLDGVRKRSVSQGSSGSGIFLKESPTPEKAPAAFETFIPMDLLNTTSSQRPEYCDALLVAGWARLDEDGEDLWISDQFIACKPRLSVGTFNVTVSLSSALISARRTNDSEELDITSYQKDFMSELNRIISATPIPDEPVPEFIWHTDPFTTDWFSSAIAARMKTNRFVDPAQPLPSVEDAIAQTEAVYRALGALYLSFDTDIFLEPQKASMETVYIHYTEVRIFLKPVMYWISVGILAFQVVVLALYCLSPHKKFLPRMPITIASTIADVAPSHALQNAGTSFEDRTTYGYGCFTGTDGALHVGIEDSSKRVTQLAPQ